MEKYIEIANDIENKILNSKIKEGEKIDSIRSLSLQYHCSKTTVIRALDLLKQKHLIYAVPKSGYFVIKQAIDVTTPESAIMDLTNAAPSWKQFPYADFQICVNKSIDTYQQDLFTYGTHRGLPSLIEEAHKLLEHYQVYSKSEQIIICSGVQQALTILCLIDFPNNKKKVLIEEPSYHLFIETLKAMNTPVSTINRTEHGINFVELERLFKDEDIKFFYTMPRIHNPLGDSYTASEKKKLVELANKYDVYLVEDDYLADFDSDTNALPLYYYDMNDKVIYLKSFSKIMFPGLRIGVAVLPSDISEVFTKYRKYIDIDSSTFSQGALDIYIKSGMFQHHIIRVRESYDKKAQLVYQSFEDYKLSDLLPQSKIKGARSYFTLPKSINKKEFISSMLKHNVKVEGLDKNYYHTTEDSRIRLDFANIEFDDLEIALQILCSEIKKTID